MFEGELLPTSFPNHEQQFVFLFEQKKKKKRTCNWMKLATLTAHKTVPQSLKSEEKNTQLLLSLMDLINHKGVNKSWRSRRMSAAA